jgi:hypothetical protein
MKLVNIDFETYSSIRTELNEYMVICNTYNYIPTKEDFTDIVNFILLYTNGGATLCESMDNFNLVDRLYESYDLNEGSWDTEKEFDTAVGTVNAVAKGAGLALLGTAAYVGYLFKKVKVMVNVAKEKKIIKNRIKNYEKLHKLKIKKWELEGGEGEPPKMELPPLG